MEMSNTAHERNVCAQTSLAAAYLDDELEAGAVARFDLHRKECADCAATIADQRRLLCLLDTAFDETFERKFAPPVNFTRVVTARAQSDMSGVRSKSERALALKICAGLGALAFVLLGATLFGEILSPIANALRGAGSVGNMLGHAAGEAGTGGAVVLRAVGGQFIAGGALSRIVQCVLLGSAVLLLTLLINHYHRVVRIGD